MKKILAVLFICMFILLQANAEEIFLHCNCIGQKYESKNYPDDNYFYDNCDDSNYISELPSHEYVTINTDEKFISLKHGGTTSENFESTPTHYSTKQKRESLNLIIHTSISRLEDGILTSINEHKNIYNGDTTWVTIYFSCTKSKQQF